MEVRGANDEGKLDDIEQSERRQNLEIVGIPSKPGENANKIVQEVAKLMMINLSEDHISTSHRLPAPQQPKNDDTGSGSRKILASPPIIARFLSRDVRHSLYANRKLLRDAHLKEFFVDGITQIFVNENLIRFRKNLLWRTKQKAKDNGFKYIWTRNGNICVRLSENCDTIMIKNEH